MVAYNNLTAGTQLFYLAQIDAVHAGKTMEIELFDPGDVGGDAFLKIMTPGRQRLQLRHVQLVRPTTAAPGTNVTQIQTASGGTQLLQQPVITILVPLPITYGSHGPDAARRDAGRLVEDRVHRRRRQRHDHLAGRHPRQPGPPRPSVTHLAL